MYSKTQSESKQGREDGEERKEKEGRKERGKEGKKRGESRERRRKRRRERRKKRRQERRREAPQLHQWQPEYNQNPSLAHQLWVSSGVCSSTATRPPADACTLMLTPEAVK